MLSQVLGYREQAMELINTAVAEFFPLVSGSDMTMRAVAEQVWMSGNK